MELAMDRKQSTQMLGEMKLFASFSAAEQRFIRRSLDIGLMRGDAIARWARNSAEAASIDAHARRYRTREVRRASGPDDDAPQQAEAFLASLITLSASDLKEDKLASFDAYRFLYERLVGAEAAEQADQAGLRVAFLDHVGDRAL